MAMTRPLPHPDNLGGDAGNETLALAREVHDILYTIQRTVGFVEAPDGEQRYRPLDRLGDPYGDQADPPEPDADSAWAEAYLRARAILKSRFECVEEGTASQERTLTAEGLQNIEYTRETRASSEAPAEVSPEWRLYLEVPLAGSPYVHFESAPSVPMTDEQGILYAGRICEYDAVTAGRDRLLLELVTCARDGVSLTNAIDYYGIAANLSEYVPESTPRTAWAAYRDRHPETVSESVRSVQSAVPDQYRPSITAQLRPSEPHERAADIIFGAQVNWEVNAEAHPNLGARPFGVDHSVSAAKIEYLIETGLLPADLRAGGNQSGPTAREVLSFAREVEAIGGAEVVLGGGLISPRASDRRKTILAGGVVYFDSFRVVPDEGSVPLDVQALLTQFRCDAWTDAESRLTTAEQSDDGGRVESTLSGDDGNSESDYISFWWD